METNPKTHDALFKWLITSFTEEFFAHYFPDVRIGNYSFIDKEFISKYEALKESLKGDLFLVMEVDIESRIHEIVIQIEHMSERKDISERVYEYLCYAWLLRKKPVWSIVVYTDDAVWRESVPAFFWYAFDSRNRKQYHHFDLIKIKAEKSGELIRKHSLLCKLLSLKADDRESDPEKLIYEIYHFASRRKERLTNEQHLLIEQWVNAYKKVSDETVDKIKKEVNMEHVATTITEQIRYESEAEGKIKGRIEGRIEGETKGKIEGKIELLEMLYVSGILSKEKFEKMIAPLREELSLINDKS